MALEIKTALNAGRKRFFSIYGPDEWEGLDWDKMALEVAPNYQLHQRLQMVFADLYNDWKALQRRKETEAAGETELRAKLAGKASWPMYDGLPSEVLADERTRDGIHILYAKPRSGLKGGGSQGNGWICPCSVGKLCVAE